ncbi:hypothetical protein JI435_435830 [Parastagonospora nodorum SN15]|uniref:Uncharacterized protein n=1 Tax=Phaeosphaeria nodorum (strain SN15 / ATCC MYA-4574 / FGSC 10173) TaxID=321614 RepID=A0A7U2I0B5_PHANO|nr:hypothetical protein HBI09_149290 [Parastagonospora nodorum]QRC98550.1 hypothetical protein JI435_435830 [Parastagonospora nodorum SN15]KAH4259602.1 hypothetical protein HBI03_135620 [Parastagonospora nodorum]KAH4281762.1 hypothetical protein HBI04_042890 [Parastagonospora nodorum]KAH4623639.1 hypothetical protein HBH55_141930 [Parastagonospora nodorum]
MIVEKGKEHAANARGNIEVFADPQTIYRRTLKKLGGPIELNIAGLSTTVGWAIWIDEDFVVSWFIPFTILTISIGIFVFAARYTADVGTPKANVWMISSFLIAAVALSFNAWVS